MASLKLTKRNIDNVAADPKRDTFYWDSALPGFGLRVTSNGAKTFVFQYRPKCRPSRRVTIGRYGVLAPDQAREIARSHAASVATGSDPLEAQRRRARDARQLLFDDYLTKFTDGCLKVEWPHTWKDARRSIELHALPRLKSKALSEIDADHIKALIDPLRSRPPTARKVWACLSRLFTWAIEERDIVRGQNPMDGVRAPVTPKARRRILSPEEIVAAWQSSYELNHPWGPFIRLLFATLQRRTEVAALPWKELSRDQRLWHLNGDRAKNDEDHLVPLNELAMAEIEALGWKPRGLAMTTTGLTGVSGFAKMKLQLDAHMLPILQDLADRQADAYGEPRAPVVLERWTLHDIRRTGTTGMQMLGIPVEVTERCINHKSGDSRTGIAKVYNLWRYEPEKRMAFDMWGRHLQRLLRDAESAAPLKEVHLQTRPAWYNAALVEQASTLSGGDHGASSARSGGLLY